ncbi:MAG: hypothetical protein IJA15_04815 [Clostridia bacterium]|nr:hypothetical protein [Clostridia bacterium]
MKTVKSRKRKFALSMKIAAMLSCIAIASVGFASWLIVNQPTDQVATGSITASAVGDANFTLTATNPATVINFGKAGTPSPNHNWLVANNIEEEVLTSAIKVDYTTQHVTKGEITVNLEAFLNTTADSTVLANLITNHYITVTVGLYSDAALANLLPGTSAVAYKVTDPEISASEMTLGASGTFYVGIKFAWGSEFGNENPYTYFNEQAKTDDLATKAETALGAIYSAANSKLNYKVTISGVATEFAE